MGTAPAPAPARPTAAFVAASFAALILGVLGLFSDVSL